MGLIFFMAEGMLLVLWAVAGFLACRSWVRSRRRADVPLAAVGVGLLARSLLSIASGPKIPDTLFGILRDGALPILVAVAFLLFLEMREKSCETNGEGGGPGG